MLVLASSEGVAGITAGATLLAGLGLAAVTMLNQQREIRARTGAQREQLDHDRELADLADLRELLDEAAVALDSARIASDDAQMRLQIGAPDNVSKELKKDFAKEAGAALDKAGPPMVALTARLKVRLGPHDPITDSFKQASEAGRELVIAALNLQIDTGRDVAEEARGAGAIFNEAEKSFTAAAVARAGTVKLRGNRTSVATD